MAHCGYEATAVADMVRKPWKGLKAAIAGIKTQGDMAPEIPLENARKADFVFEKVVEDQLRRAEMHATGAEGTDADSRAA